VILREEWFCVNRDCGAYLPQPLLNEEGRIKATLLNEEGRIKGHPPQRGEENKRLPSSTRRGEKKPPSSQ
jgi:hypothetical protein